MRAALLAAMVAVAGCKSGPAMGPPGGAALTLQQLTVSQQGLTEFKVRFEGQVSSPAAATLESADYELVLDGKTLKSGQEKLGIGVLAGSSATFALEEGTPYVGSAEELKAMAAHASDGVVALRGKIHLAGGTALEFGKSRDLRLPRLPNVVMNQVDFARYSADEVSGTFYVGVANPNPFPIRIDGLTYQATIAGKKLGDGELGRGEEVAAAATGVFEVQVAVNQETYGPDVAKVIKTLTLPYELVGQLEGKLIQEPYSLKGDIKLNVTH